MKKFEQLKEMITKRGIRSVNTYRLQLSNDTIYEYSLLTNTIELINNCNVVYEINANNKYVYVDKTFTKIFNIKA